MTNVAIILAIAAGFGVLLAGIRLSGKPLPPTWLALVHGAFAVVGFGWFIYLAMTQTIPSLAQVSLGLFVLAALGGLTLFLFFHLRGRALPVVFVLGHGVIAATAYVLLLLSIFG